MYHIHLTKAFIIEKIQTKDDDVSLLILSEDFGLVWMYAYGLRKEQSKLRYTLQIGQHVECALVRGKAGWQVVNAILLESMPTIPTAYESLVRLHQVIKRVIPQEEEKSGYAIYAVLKNILQQKEHTLDIKEAALYIAVLNILNEGGYGVEYPLEKGEEVHYDFSEKNLRYVLQNQIQVNKDVTAALNASQL